MKNKIKNLLKFLIPFGIWCVLFYPIFSEQALISSETLHIYSVVKFYLNNLKLGVFPLWDPFVMWGEPTQIFFNYAGVFNPLWLLIFVLGSLGLDFYHSFLCVITLYFWVGQWGFYLLAKRILKNTRAAYAAFILFLFSSVSMSLYAQFHAQLLYIPGIWFFYFLFTFFKKPSSFASTGLILTTAVIFTSYLPFYFLTVFTIVMALVFVLYYPAVKTLAGSAMKFVQTHVWGVGVSLGVIFLSVVPGYLAYQSTARQEVVAPFRNEDVDKKAGVYFNNYEKIAKNGFTGRMDIEDLYSNFDLVQYGDDCFFYVSLFFYLVLIMGAILRLNRLLVACALTALPLFFLIITSAARFHRFLFEHLGYFKLIRNMHFFLPFFLAALILFVAEQLRLFFDDQNSFAGKKRAGFLFFIVLIHGGIGVFLLRHAYVPVCSYATLGFSLLFWLTYLLGPKSGHQALLSVLLFLSIIAQPLEVIGGHNQRGTLDSSYLDKAFIAQAIAVPWVKPVFSYTRPVSSQVVGNDDTANWRISMKDASRFFENGFPTFWSYALTLKVPFDDLQKYTANKFYIYDGVDVLNNDEHLENLISYFRTGRNVALISGPKDTRPLAGLMDKSKRASLKSVSVIREPSPVFQVIDFNVNTIKIQTQYAQEKLLIYTDNYHKNWEGFVNGKPAVVYRANFAFKGIYLPPGRNEVYLCYRPSVVGGMSVLLSVVLAGVLGYLLFLRMQEKLVWSKGR